MYSQNCSCFTHAYILKHRVPNLNGILAISYYCPWWSRCCSSKIKKIKSKSICINIKWLSESNTNDKKRCKNDLLAKSRRTSTKLKYYQYVFLRVNIQKAVLKEPLTDYYILKLVLGNYCAWLKGQFIIWSCFQQNNCKTEIKTADQRCPSPLYTFLLPKLHRASLNTY